MSATGPREKPDGKRPERPRVLLHICCAPCAIHPTEELRKENGSDVTGFFYNPNIHPRQEMERRRDALLDYAEKEKLEVVFDDYDERDFFDKIGDEKEPPARCGICWRMRLERTALYAVRHGFDAFTTTLLVSPYQDYGMMAKIGSELSEELGIAFLARDWRPGFRKAQQLARERGIYRQKYCGCVFSIKERSR